MKNTTLAAAKKVAKKAVKKAAVKKSAAKKVAKKAAPKKAAPRKPAAKKAAAKSIPKTTIVAHTDIGFGNTLFLRGDAPGLSWSQGVPMDCPSGNSWSISIAGVARPFEFKVLINDAYWNAGYNEVAQPGAETTIVPSF